MRRGASIGILLVATGCGRIGFETGGGDAAVDAPPGCVVALATKSHNTCVIRTDRTLWCAGSNVRGQLGDNSTQDSAIPKRVAGLPGIVRVAIGVANTYALDETGTVWAWGHTDDRLQIGNGSIGPDHLEPTAVFANAAEIAAGESHACAVDRTGAVYCWGWNVNGQIGNGTMTNQPTPQLITTNAQKIAAGGRRTCVIKTDQTVWCWGQNGSGEVGDGTLMSRTTPTQIPGFSAVDVVAGGHHTCARRADDSVWCWGRNVFGQLGDGTTTSAASPQPVPGLPRVASLFGTGGRRTCARLLDGENWCWGEPRYGVLGTLAIPAAIDRPMHAVDLDGATLGAAASAHTCVRAANGDLACSGFNDQGQLGDGSQADRAALVPALFSCP